MKYPKVSEPVHPRKEFLPPIHERNNQIYTHIHWGLKSTQGLDNKWLEDIFQQYREVSFNFSTYKNCAKTISNHGRSYDKDIMNSDYAPKLKEARDCGYLQPGYRSPGDLLQYMINQANIKEHLIVLSFARGEHRMDILEEEYYKEKLAEQLIAEYKPEVKFKDFLSKMDDILTTVREELIKFLNQFEADMQHYTDYNVISKYIRDQALVYMMLCRDEFKQSIREYETYCKTIAVCEARYDELIKSRFDKEFERMKRTKKFIDSDEKEIIDAMMLRYEKSVANGTNFKTYNPKYYLEMIQNNRLPIPRNFVFLHSIVDVPLLKKILSRWDGYTVKYLNFAWNSDTWNVINGLDRILNEDNVRYVNGVVTPNPNKEETMYNYDFIRSIDIDKDKPRIKNKHHQPENVVSFTNLRYKFLKS